MINLSGTVGWLKKDTCIFFSLWVCRTVGWLYKNDGNISTILVGYVGHGKALWDCGMACKKDTRIFFQLEGLCYCEMGPEK